jgi:polyhydroxyalkanoate synthesis regulator phasin
MSDIPRSQPFHIGTLAGLIEPDERIGYDQRWRVTKSIPSQEVAMVDLIKKALYIGVGLAVLTKEKAEELVKELTQQAKLSEEEGKELFDGLLKQSEQARNDLQSKLDEAVLAVVNRLKLATKDEVASLKAKVDELSAKIGEGTKA